MGRLGSFYLWNSYTYLSSSISNSYAGVAFFVAPAEVGGHEERILLDIVMLAIGAGAFVLLIGYVALCERL